jgi:hypothetical protein
MMKINRIAVVCHDLLQNAPKGYCIVEATITYNDEIHELNAFGFPEDRSYVVQGEKNPYTKGRFVWGEIDTETGRQIRAFPTPVSPAPPQLDAIAEALKSLFDELSISPVPIWERKP